MACTLDETAENSGSWYRKANFRQGDTVRFNKHFLQKDHYATKWDSELWEDNYVHMESDFGAEDYFDNAKPVIIFDKDLDATGEDRYLGYDPSTVFLNDVQVSTTWVLIASCSRLVLPTASATRSWRPRPSTLASTIPSQPSAASVIPAVAPTRGATGRFNSAGHPMPVVSARHSNGRDTCRIQRRCPSTSVT